MNGAVARTLAFAVVVALAIVALAGASLSGATLNGLSPHPPAAPFPHGGPNIPAPITGPVGPTTTQISWTGGQTITTPVAYANATIDLSGGSLTVAAGGALAFDNVTLVVSESVGGGVTGLTYGISVLSGGTFDAKYSTLESGSGSTGPTYLVLSGTGWFVHDRFIAFGGTGASPVIGKEGVVVESPGASFVSDAFDHVYQVLFTGSLARGGLLHDSVLTNSTMTGGGGGWVQVSGGASWANITDNLLNGWADAGRLVWISGPHVTLSGNGFAGDPTSTQQSQVLITYDGYSDSGLDGSYAQVIGNWFQVANLQVMDSSYVTIQYNWINDTGLWGGTAGSAAILVVTWIGSGVDLYTRHLQILDNSISNFTHYGIRVSQNVSGFNVSGNHIFNTESEYSTAITEADGIYLIRQVNNGTVWNNTIDMTDAVQPSEPANGIVLESLVNDVNVTGNRVLNCSEVGITVQGDDNAIPEPSFFVGGSFRDVLYKNVIANYHSVAAQTLYSSDAIQTWMWANDTKILDNVVEGWSEVNLAQYYNGAALYTSSSDQLIAGNVFSDVRYGFIFSVFAPSWEQPAYGSFNRSYNTLENNSVTGVTVHDLVENAADGMGPIVNILRGGLDPSWSLWFSGSSCTLRVVDGYIPSLRAGSPFAVPNVQFYPVLHLEQPNVTDSLGSVNWVGGVAVVAYASFMASTTAATAGDNLTILSYSPSTDAVTWTSDNVAGGISQFDFSAVVPGAEYALAMDGIQLSSYNLSGIDLTIPLTFIGFHQFALTQLHPGSSPPVLQAGISPSNASGLAPLSVDFRATVTGGSGPYSYNWSFGDGTYSTAEDPTHVYRDAGSYSAIFTVTDSQSGRATSSTSVSVSPGPPNTGPGNGSGPGGNGSSGGGIVSPPLQSPPPALLRNLAGAAIGLAVLVPAIFFWARRTYF